MNTAYGQSVSAPFVSGTSSYPVQVAFQRQESHNRFFAIPLIGLLARVIMLIPYMIAWYVLALVVSLSQLVLWIPVVFGGQFPQAGANLVGGFIRWTVRMNCYLFGITDSYPSFSLQDQPGSHDALVNFQIPAASNRFWAIPVIGAVVKGIILIPHYIVLYVLGLVVGVLLLVAWFPVISTGRYPEWGYNVAGGYLRWSARVLAYHFGLTDVYPPFQLGE